MIPIVKGKTSRPIFVDQEAVVVLARGPQHLSIDLVQVVQARGPLLKGRATKLCASQTATQGIAGCGKEIEGNPWKQSVPDVEPLRHPVEGEGDERPVGRSSSLCLVQRSLQKLIAKSTTLLAGRDEKLCKKPEVVANPAEGKADDPTFV